MSEKEKRIKDVALLKTDRRLQLILLSFEDLSFKPTFSWEGVTVSVREWATLTGQPVSVVRKAFMLARLRNFIRPDKTLDPFIKNFLYSQVRDFILPQKKKVEKKEPEKEQAGEDDE